MPGESVQIRTLNCNFFFSPFVGNNVQGRDQSAQFQEDKYPRDAQRDAYSSGVALQAHSLLAPFADVEPAIPLPAFSRGAMKDVLKPPSGFTESRCATRGNNGSLISPSTLSDPSSNLLPNEPQQFFLE